MKKSIRISTLLLIAIITIVGTAPSLFAEDAGKADLSGGALVLTFDDAFVSQWLAAADIFKQYDARATFFVSNSDRLSKQQIDSLARLRKEGHTIGCHSLRHRKAVDFAKKHGIKKYLQSEITPAVKALRAAGFSPTAFAYPNSQNNEETDAALLKIFRHLRT
ncbi:MAG: polysaccharide deacetylase family protein, partial [Pirellulales bacterium]|nr:polysaccharide deacetylase family protein [Pirellulales bacterium]